MFVWMPQFVLITLSLSCSIFCWDVSIEAGVPYVMMKTSFLVFSFLKSFSLFLQVPELLYKSLAAKLIVGMPFKVFISLYFIE